MMNHLNGLCFCCPECIEESRRRLSSRCIGTDDVATRGMLVRAAYVAWLGRLRAEYQREAGRRD